MLLYNTKKAKCPRDIGYFLLRSEDARYMALNQSLLSSADVKNVWYIISHFLKLTLRTA